VGASALATPFEAQPPNEVLVAELLLVIETPVVSLSASSPLRYAPPDEKLAPVVTVEDVPITEIDSFVA
jgi:hypothetical protein